MILSLFHTLQNYCISLYTWLVDKTSLFNTVQAYYHTTILPLIHQHLWLKYVVIITVLLLGLFLIRFIGKFKAQLLSLHKPPPSKLNRSGIQLVYTGIKALTPTFLLFVQFWVVYGLLIFGSSQFPMHFTPRYLSYAYIVLSNLFIITIFYKLYTIIDVYEERLFDKIKSLDLSIFSNGTLKRLIRLVLVFFTSLMRVLVYISMVIVYVMYLESTFKGLVGLDLDSRLNGVLLLLVLITYRHSFRLGFLELVKILRRFSTVYTNDLVISRIAIVSKDQFTYLIFSILKGLLFSASLFLALYVLKQSAILILLGAFDSIFEKVSLIVFNLALLILVYRLLSWLRTGLKSLIEKTLLFSRIAKLYLNINKTSVFNAINFAPFIKTGLKTLDIVAIGLAGYMSIGIILRILPMTRDFSNIVFGHITTPLLSMIQAVIGYIPNLFTITIILVISNYLMDFSKFFFQEIEDGNLSFNGFYTEFARPTYKITRFLIIILTIVIAFPYLPLSNSPAFKGISVFLGVLFSLGSSSFVSNIVSGIMITYMRPFKVGDRVKIADTMGEVIEKTLLVTRIKTLKNVYIAIPNSLILGTHITNFSFMNKEVPIILHTTVTIGYDVPWKTVHELLLNSVSTVGSILKTPKPFVLQTKLSDFYIEYEVNAYTNYVDGMPHSYSQIHQNIQDQFRQANIEILSPHYRVERSEEMPGKPST